MSSSLSRTPRLEAADLVSRLAELTGVQFAIEGPCPGGEVGAAYVRWPDGRRSVLTMGSRHAPPLVLFARRAGLPVPEYELTADLGDAFVVVQELVVGSAPAVVDRPLVDSLIALNAAFTGLLSSLSRPPIDLYLRSSGPGFCVHESLASYDRRSARVLDWVREVGAVRNTADGPDLVHVDYHPGNILVSDGRITAILDWDGVGQGDRLFDLVTLRFDLAWRAPLLTFFMDDLLVQTLPADRLRAYWAHMSLRLVDWSIRHHTSAEVDVWLATAEHGIRAWS
jgi:Phosphotransferase enzyme family